eukprot:CAMPEP_0118942302 /NCGR_PEP_ID=MMETSP1169-20130426/35919_1 /TAXON_ID=36882 /ORGANISM="Pyramimonas obovata, Strain CCMP722" /LENGTH=428 /DNA_ID=CAMNT_0006887303 /DNA_START=376 /DNA_END=1658 /DNA_ORIENTATION=+
MGPPTKVVVTHSEAPHVRPDTIKIVADSVGISKLSDEVASSLSPDVEYRMREIIQESLKFMRHSKRSILTTEDVNCGLRLRNVEPLYGFAAGTEPLHFAQPEGHKDVFFLKDKELEFDEIITAPFPKCPVDVTVVPHWLAVEGVQPAIPENPPPPVEKPSLKRTREEAGGARPAANGATPNGSAGKGPGLAGTATEVMPVASHLLSKELQLYFERITELVKGPDERLRDAALLSLASDPGLHQLLPYFTTFISNEVTANLKALPLLSVLMRMLRGLLLNPHHNIELYLHQLMPSIITCMVAKRLSKEATEDHWRLRDYSASTLALVCGRFGAAYPNIQPRVTRTLVRAFLDPARPLATHYGAIMGLASLGPRVSKLLLLPNLPTYLAWLQPELCAGSQPNELKRMEANRVYGALQVAVSTCMSAELRL